jgi:DnaJ family protein B protein 12
MNHDEAERCLDLAAAAEREGNLERALKLYLKAMKLHPVDSVTSKAKERIVRIQVLLSKSSSQETPHTPSAPPPPPPRSAPRNTPQQQEEKADSDSQQKPFTPEQNYAVQRVLKAVSYYEILGVTKTADTLEIKRKYKRVRFLFFFFSFFLWNS